MTTSTKPRKQSEISAPAIFRIKDKQGKVLGYGVPSDTQPGVVYHVSYDFKAHRYTCSCPATKPCKHERAVQAVVQARRNLAAAQAMGNFFLALAQVADELESIGAISEPAEQVAATEHPAVLDAEEIAAVIDEETYLMPIITAEHAAKTERVVAALIGETKPIATKRDANHAPLNGNRSAPVAAEAGNPTPSAWLPMR